MLKCHTVFTWLFLWTIPSWLVNFHYSSKQLSLSHSWKRHHWIPRIWRTIDLFPIFFYVKVLEEVVLSQILQHINCNKLLSDFQSAYCPHRSPFERSDKWFSLYNGWWQDLGACASGSLCSIWRYWPWNLLHVFMMCLDLATLCYLGFNHI